MTKRFGTVQALAGVDIDFAPAEIHAVLGENGAGKSTLMHVIYGLTPYDAGTIWLADQRVRFRSPIEARHAGIGMVHQEFALVDALSVAENLALALSGPSDWLLRRGQVGAAAVALAERIGLQIGPLSVPVGDLPVGARQRIEIVKALADDTRILILDEPTAVLTPGEAEQLFRVMRALRAQGSTVLFITHRLHEVVEVADRVTVLRRGRALETVACKDATAQQLAELMMGAVPAPPTRATKTIATADPPALRITKLSATDDRALPALQDLSLTIRPGEVFGIAGVDGNGQWELFQALAGLRQPAGGTIEVAGSPVHYFEPATMIAAGIGYIPPDRRRQGAILEMSVADNALLNVALLRRLRHGPFLDRTAARAFAADVVREYAVRTERIDSPAASLSGGNLQRLIVGRTLKTLPRLLVAFNPTRGLDVVASQAVGDALQAALARQTAMLLISTDLDEIFALSDRVAVLYRGQLSPAYERPFPAGRIATLMAGEQ